MNRVILGHALADTAELLLQHSADVEAVAAEGRAMKELLLSSLSPEELQSVLDDRLPASRRGADEVVEDAADACRALLAAAQAQTEALRAENAQLQKEGADAKTQQVAAAEKQVSSLCQADRAL